MIVAPVSELLEHEDKITKHSPWISKFLFLFLAQTAGSFVFTSIVTGLTRTAVFLVVLPLITTMLCTADCFRSKGSILSIIAGTLATFASITVGDERSRRETRTQHHAGDLWA
jgi:hypothetical protein